MSFILGIAVKLTIGFIALVIFMNMNGKSQLTPLSTGDQIGNYVLGGIIGGVIYSPSITILQFLVVLLIWGLLMTTITFLKNNSQNLKNIVDGQIIFLVKDSEIQIENFTKANMTISDFYMKIRMKGVFRIKDISEAFLESNGQLIIIKRNEENLGVLLVSEGKILEHNLEHIEKNTEWLWSELENKGVQDISEIFLAEFSKDKLFIVKRENR